MRVLHSTSYAVLVQEAYRPDSPAGSGGGGSGGGAALPEPEPSLAPRLPAAAPAARDSLAVLLEVRGVPGALAAVCAHACQPQLLPHVKKLVWPTDVAETHIAAAWTALLQGLSGLDQLLQPQAGEGASGLPTEQQQQQQLVRLLTGEWERLLSLGTGDWAAALQELQQQPQQQQQQQLEQQGAADGAGTPSQGKGAGAEAEAEELAAAGAAAQQQQPVVKQEGAGGQPLGRASGRAGRKRLLSRTTSGGIQGMEGVERS